MVNTAPSPFDVLDFQFKLHCRLNIFETDSDDSFSNICSLLACASRYGLIFVGTKVNNFQVIQQQDIVNNTDKEFKNYPRRIVELPGVAQHLSVNCDCTKLSVVVERDGCATAIIYDVLSFLKQSIFIIKEIRLSPTPNVKVLQTDWNPAIPDIFTACKSDGSLAVYEFKGNALDIHEIPNAAATTCFCWSPKGKQIAVGSKDGKITQYKPDLKPVKSINGPVLDGNFSIISMQWASSFQFIGVYKSTTDANASSKLIVIDAPKTGNPTYTNYEDICYSYGNTRPYQFYLILEQHWNILFVSSSNGSEVGVLGLDGTKWMQWCLEDSSRAELPLSNKRQETYSIGFAINTGYTKTIVSGDTTLPPAPALLILSNHGVLCCFDILNMKANAPSVCSPPESITDKSGLNQFVTVEKINPIPAEVQKPVVSSNPVLPSVATKPSLSNQPLNNVPAWQGSVQNVTTTKAATVHPSLSINLFSKPETPKVMEQKTVHVKPQEPAVVVKPDLKSPDIDNINTTNINDRIPINIETELMIAKLVREECLALELELKAVLYQGKKIKIEIGNDNEASNMAEKAGKLEEFVKAVKETSQSQAAEIHALKQSLIQAWAWYEEARSRYTNGRDPSLLALQKTKKIRMPTMETIYQSMVKQTGTLQKQRYILKDISSRINSYRKINMGSKILISNEIDNVAEELNKLQVDSIASSGINAKLYERQSKLTTEKSAKLFKFLNKRNATHVAVSKPTLNNSTIHLNSLLQPATPNIKHEQPLAEPLSPIAHTKKILPQKMDFVMSTPKPVPISSASTPFVKAEEHAKNMPAQVASALPKFNITTDVFKNTASRPIDNTTNAATTTYNPPIFGAVKTTTSGFSFSSKTISTSATPTESGKAMPVSKPIQSTAAATPNSFSFSSIFGSTAGTNTYKVPSIVTTAGTGVTAKPSISIISSGFTTNAPLKISANITPIDKPATSTISNFGLTITPVSTVGLPSNVSKPVVPTTKSLFITPTTGQTIGSTKVASTTVSPFVQSQIKPTSTVASTSTTVSTGSFFGRSYTSTANTAPTTQSTVTSTSSIWNPTQKTAFSNIFGGQPTATTSAPLISTTSSILGSQVATTSSNTVVSSATGSIFGSQSATSAFPASTTTGSIFGSQSATSAFPSSTTTVANAPSTTTPASTTTSSTLNTSASTTSIFKVVTTSTTSPFGTSTTSSFGGVQTSTSVPSIFKTVSSTTNATSIAATTNTTSLFGNTSQSTGGALNLTVSSTTTSSSNVFGSQNTVFGSKQDFGTSTTTTTVTPFGTTTTTSSSPFGSIATNVTQASPFGTTSTNTSSVLPFGNKTTTSATTFGNQTTTTAASPFGSLTTNTTTASPFGASTTNVSSSTTFGAQPVSTTSASPFGTNTSSVFGGSTNQSVFGGTDPTTTSASVFAGFGSSTVSSGNVFGASASPFGNTTTTTTSASAFGTTSPFGATTSASTFGTPSPFGTTTTSGSNTFGAASPFGAKSSPFGAGSATATGSVFGQPSTFGNSGGSIFGGNATTTASGVFGGTSGTFGTTTTTSSSPFGGSSVFGANTANTGSPFGSASPFGQSQTQQQGFGTFGGNKPATFSSSGSFGNTNTNSFSFNSLNMGATPTTSSGFGQSNANPFGRTNEQKFPAFSSANLFGNTATTSSGSTFGGTSPFSKPAFGNTASPGFGTPPAFGQSSGFGGGAGFGTTGSFSAGGQSVQQSGFGSPGFQKSPSSGAFGNPPAFGSSSPGFGAPPSFGSSPAFGSSPSFGSPPKVFGGTSTGTTASTGFGTTQNSNFGNLANQSTLGFGNLAQQSTASQPSGFSGGGSSFSSWR
ncbi:PREDICTED: nuclear pore complex protein DDB_G0274915-like [Nicrophorus vespilloides]|uniref:Nuclear pore complex protein DDB_G0274915-like n=1 Tax=Nicrophorus vespilloides TaxID=110193 RepID=A0ABM1MD02_NICVS|nr:PREDICTED: nuclear pore complex protein DDB_G0274915-like [Nicrophorus vespilloides]